MGSELSRLPLFLQEWAITAADQNLDGVLSSQEQQSIICDFAKALKSEAGRVGPLVKADGRIDWVGYLASDDVMSAYEFRYALSIIAEKWNQELLRDVAGEGLTSAQVMNFIKSGHWSISEPDIAAQEDLMGVDQSRHGQLQKQLGLAYRLSVLKSKSQDAFSDLAPIYMKIAIQQKNIPWIQGVNRDQKEMSVAFNQVTITEVGVPGAKRYYVLHGTPAKLRVGKDPVWYQPSQQSTFMLTEKNAFGDTTRYVELLRRKLARLCRNSSDSFQLSSSPMNANSLQARLQIIVAELSDAFLVDTPTVTVSSEGLEGGATAYHDRSTGGLSFSLPLIQSVAKEVSGKDLDRHLTFLVMQEFIHSLQFQANDYELNFRLYNAPQWSHAMFGEVGYQDYYLGQPIERDAQLLAGQFAEAVQTECASYR